jgi:hypothetical protein
MVGGGSPANVITVSILPVPRTRRPAGGVKRRAVNLEEDAMADDFEYVSQSRLEYRHGYRQAYLGEVPAPVVYGVQGRLREYYGVAEGPPVASTLDHIVAAVAG